MRRATSCTPHPYAPTRVEQWQDLSTAQMVRSFQLCDGNRGELVTEAEKENRDAEVGLRVGVWVVAGIAIDLPSHTLGSCGRRLWMQTRVLARRVRLG